MRRFPYLVAAGLMLAFSADQVAAHLPDGCAGHALQAQERIALYSESLEDLHRLSADEVFNHVPEVRRVIRLSLDAIDATTAVVICVKSGGKVEEASAYQDTDSDHEKALAQEICLVEARLEKRARDAIAEAEFRIEIAGMSPTEQNVRRALRERRIAIENVRQRHEIAKKCREADTRALADQ